MCNDIVELILEQQTNQGQPSSTPHTPSLSRPLDNGLVHIGALQQINYASDFSGMDCGAYILKTYIHNVVKHQWASERNTDIHNFLQVNYGISHRNLYREAKHTFKPEEVPHLYVAGPPCQPFSSAGKQNIGKTRGQHYFTVPSTISCETGLE